jgi:hypothetical protein
MTLRDGNDYAANAGNDNEFFALLLRVRVAPISKTQPPRARRKRGRDFSGVGFGEGKRKKAGYQKEVRPRSFRPHRQLVALGSLSSVALSSPSATPY